MIRITLNRPINLQALMFNIDKELKKYSEDHDITNSVLCVDIHEITHTIEVDRERIENKKSIK